MTLIIDNGSLSIYDDTSSGAPKVYGTDWRLFHYTDGISTPMTGTVSTPTRTATRTITSSSNVHDYVDIDVNTPIRSIHAMADVVRGQFFVSTSGTAYGVSNIGWFDASGSYVHYLGPNNAALGGPGNVSLKSIASYTFYASGGTLYLNERVRLDAPRSFSNGVYRTILNGVTFQYSLRAGTFT